MGAWGCPHEIHGQCQRIKGRACDPGMKGCILFGRFVWSNEAKNAPRRPTTAPSLDGPQQPTPPSKAGDRAG